MQQLTAPSNAAPPPPPPPPPPAPAAAAPELRLSPVAAAPVRNTNSNPVVNLQEPLQPNKVEIRPAKRKKKRGKKLIMTVLFLGMIGGVGYAVRDSGPARSILHRDEKAADLPDVPFVRPSITSAEYSVTTTAVQNGVPNNVTTKIRADFSGGVSDNVTESQTGGTFASVEQITTRDTIYRPGAAFGATWTRQPRDPAVAGPYDAAEFIPMVDEIVDQPLREAMEPTASKTEVVDGVTMTSMTYVIDRARVPEIATAIYARVPWLFDVPNATTLTVDVTYDESGVVRHLHFGVEPPQPGTGSDATWITGYTLDVTSLNVPVSIELPVGALDVPPGTP